MKKEKGKGGTGREAKREQKQRNEKKITRRNERNLKSKQTILKRLKLFLSKSYIVSKKFAEFVY